MKPIHLTVRRVILLLILGIAPGLLRAQTPEATSPPPRQPAARRGPIDLKPPTIFIAGDSTAAPSSGGGGGWGVPFATYFDSAKVKVVNDARGGRSSRTFITDGTWDTLLAEVKSGDVVLIQFGHNDVGVVNQVPPGSKEPLRARGSLPGLGEETQEIDNVVTHKHEIVHTFGWYMRKMINETRVKGAVPIVLSLTVRNNWKDGKVERGLGEYRKWAEEIAEHEGVAFVDLTSILADEYDKMGEAAVKRFFPRDNTHTNAEGSEFCAAAVVAGIKALPRGPASNHRLEPYFSPKGAETAPAAAARVHAPDLMAWLNLPTPANPGLPTLFLIGDSTVRNGRSDGANGQWGWGAYLAPYFTRINVVNRAVGGTSSRSFGTLGYWGLILAMMKPGDFVMMQFGHIDTSLSRARSTIPGMGEETEDFDNPMTHEHEVIHTYGWYLRKLIADTRAKGATPIICSLVPRKHWKDGKIARNKEDYAGWAEQVAKAAGVAFVDLNEIIARRYDALGQEKVEPLFGDPGVHTSQAGAELSAACVVSGLKGLKDDPLASYLSAKAEEVTPYAP